MQTLARAALVDVYACRWAEALDGGLRAIALAPSAGDLLAEVLAHYSVSLAYTVLGNPEQALQHAAAALPPAETLRHRSWLCRALWAHDFASSTTGDWATARRFSDRGLEASSLDIRPLFTRAVLEYEQGDSRRGAVYVDRLTEVMRATPPGPNVEYMATAMVIPVVAWITGDSSRVGVAEMAARTLLSFPVVTPLVPLVMRAGLALLAVLRGDGVAAAEHYTALSGTRGRIFIVSYDRVLGLLARTMGDLEGATAHFEDALAFCGKAGYRPQLAWTCYDYAEMLLQRDRSQGLSGSGDRAKATELLEEALRLSRELGMRPLMERVLARRELLTA